MEPKTPWLKNYGDVPFHIDYPDISMYEAVRLAAEKNPEATALSFMGRDISYKKMISKIDRVAGAFAAIGIKQGDHVTVCMPNVPQTVYALYALNSIGVIVSMIHPLSAQGEIVFYLNEAKSDCVLTLDQFYYKFVEVRKQVEIKNLIVASVADELTKIKATGYKVINIRKKVNFKDNAISWKDFISEGKKFKDSCKVEKKGKDPAVVLFSGGTTGVTKGILLSNLNFNALAMQTEAMCHCEVVGKSMLAAMPMFHGFGLGVCVHTMLVAGAKSILVPRFNIKEYAKLIKKERPNFIAGVPTLFEAITRNPYLDGVCLDFLMGVFSGGDSLSIELKKKFDTFLKDHGATVKIREGYGTTECVTASCLTPYHIEKIGSIGLPYPDTYYKICKPNTTQELAFGEEGEICLCGPSVMIGYLNHPEENANTLRHHEDGNIWLHTGDLGYMDCDGFIYFKQRIKRMIITSGYNVYPSQIENVLEAHEAVSMSCVIGVKDAYKMQKVKAFVVLRDGFTDTPELKKSIMDHCKKQVAKYAMPYEIEIRDTLPKTLVGKIAYTILESEELENQKLMEEKTS